MTSVHCHPRHAVERLTWLSISVLQLLVMPFLKKRIDRAFETIDK
jgi:hypothetical protein